MIFKKHCVAHQAKSMPLLLYQQQKSLFNFKVRIKDYYPTVQHYASQYIHNWRAKCSSHSCHTRTVTNHCFRAPTKAQSKISA
jgi:hypothetical protein